MAAPTFASLYRISVRRADGGISFRPKTHDTSRPSAAKMRAQMTLFASKMTGKNIAGDCKGKKFRAFRGCLRSRGAAAYRGS
jgi:hypothetical protein